MKILTCIAFFAASTLFTLPADAGQTKKALTFYATGVCKPKIDAKKLKGDQRKEAWAACKADPDNYN